MTGAGAGVTGLPLEVTGAGVLENTGAGVRGRGRIAGAGAGTEMLGPGVGGKEEAGKERKRCR